MPAWNHRLFNFRQLRLPSLLFYLSLLLLGHQTYAATVLGVSLEEMLQNSELVFEGKTINIETRKEGSYQQIYTYVTFEILDIIKGEYHEDTLKLRFDGGTIDGITLSISGMRIPELGETGIYFVESLTRNQVHPFYGWSQGHFVVYEDEAGVERISTRGKRPVVAVELYQKDVSEFNQGLNSGDGIAKGVITSTSPESQQGLEKFEFKDKLHEMLRPQK